MPPVDNLSGFGILMGLSAFLLLAMLGGPTGTDSIPPEVKKDREVGDPWLVRLYKADGTVITYRAPAYNIHPNVRIDDPDQWKDKVARYHDPR